MITLLADVVPPRSALLGSRVLDAEKYVCTYSLNTDIWSSTDRRSSVHSNFSSGLSLGLRLANTPEFSRIVTFWL